MREIERERERDKERHFHPNDLKNTKLISSIDIYPKKSDPLKCPKESETFSTIGLNQSNGVYFDK